MPISEHLTATGFAKLCGVTGPTVSTWCQAGMPHEGGGHGGAKFKIPVREAIAWIVTSRTTQRNGSERERLAAEQADRVAIENAKSRGELLSSVHVEDTIASANASLAQQLQGIPGRMATPLASVDDPAIIRSELVDEIRRIRESYAQQFAELVDAGGDRSADGADSDATA